MSLLFVAAGGAVAVAWNENSALKCIAVGAGLPAIISALAQAYGGRR